MFSRHDRDRVAGLRADVDSLQARLAADVSNLNPGDDPVCRQAMADASERATATGALMSRADSAAELDVAKRTVLEGLTATRLVRERQGLPLGPDLPPDRRTVDADTPVEVDGHQYTAHPEYHPERPHFFGGGLGAPGGYYRTPFWQKALAVGGALAGAEMLGDLIGGGGGWVVTSMAVATSTAEAAGTGADEGQLMVQSHGCHSGFGRSCPREPGDLRLRLITRRFS